MEKPKKKIFANLVKMVKPFLRGTLKSLPIVGPAIELHKNIKAEIAGTEKPHNYASIFMQLVCTTIVVIAFVRKDITIDQVIEYLSSILNAF